MKTSLMGGAAAVCMAAGLLTACTTPAPSDQPPSIRIAAPPAAPPAPVAPAGRVLGRSDRFLIYQPATVETLRAIAARFLGSEARSWWISDFNGSAEVEAGRPLVVPLKPVNPIGVWTDRYQTVPILCYHRFGDGGGKMVMSAGSFAAQLAWLARNDYHVIPLAQLSGYLAGREPLPKRSVVITIDDGYESVHRIALPLLREHGFPATLFIYTDFIGAADALTWAQLQELATSGLIDVQVHSKTHRNLIESGGPELDDSYRRMLDTETRVPRELLEKRLPIQVRHFAYPYGDANQALLDALGRQRYQLGLTVNPGGNAFFAQPLMLRRTMIYGDQTLDAFKLKLQVERWTGLP